MPRIFDNISQQLLGALRATLQTAIHADFGVGYFNLRGWQALDDLIAAWNPANGQVCRVLIGMQRPPNEEVKALYQARSEEDGLIDNARASLLKQRFAQHLREQVTSATGFACSTSCHSFDRLQVINRYITSESCLQTRRRA